MSKEQKPSGVVRVFPKEPTVKIYVYFKNGNVYTYTVEGQWKAREHADKIMNFGFRANIGSRLEWFGTHYIDKVCWDNVNGDYLSNKYE